MKTYKYLIILSLFVGTKLSYAQETNTIDTENKKTGKAEISKDYKPFDFNLQVKNMHLWRGYRVTDAPMTAANVSYTSKSAKFKAGIWGGAGFNGDYTEFDYYVSYTNGGFSLSLWDINNFSSFPNAEIFDYSKETTSHFVDLTAAYAFKKIPFSISWSTILLGRDTFLDDSGKLSNAYSNFLQINSTIYKDTDSSLSIYIAGAFAFNSSESHFYGTKFLNSFGLTFSKDVKVFNKKYIPVSASAMWNTDLQYGGLKVAVDLF